MYILPTTFVFVPLLPLHLVNGWYIDVAIAYFRALLYTRMQEHAVICLW